MSKKKTGGNKSAARVSDIDVIKAPPADAKKRGKGKVDPKLGLNDRTDESIIDSTIFYDEANEWIDGEEYEDESEHKLHPVLSRTSMLLQDYREFKAARTIQTAARGWYVRHIIAKQTRAASIIQRAWRFFYAKRYYYRLLERTLQERIEAHYYRCAQLIQSLWRGYWVRENVHDQYRMRRMQMRAAEDLLHCVAFKLHHLLRTHQIPGIYSLRNSHCLSKVEQLLAAMSYKKHNDHVRLARQKRENRIKDLKNAHKESAYQTDIPYPGPNFEGICEPKCCALYKEADADKKMFKILSIYERAAGMDPRLRKIRTNPKSRKSSKSGTKRRRATVNDFCTDVVNSMKRWNILSPNNVTIDPNVFKNPENVEKFLTEIQSMNSFMHPRCYCHVDLNEILERQILLFFEFHHQFCSLSLFICSESKPQTDAF